MRRQFPRAALGSVNAIGVVLFGAYLILLLMVLFNALAAWLGFEATVGLGMVATFLVGLWLNA